MLNSILKDAIQKREQTLSILKGPEFEQIIKQAKSNWVDFSPTKQDVTSAGIDSSFNSTKFQGAELWAVTAVSAKSDGEILVDLHDHGLDSNPELASLASKMEIDACIESNTKKQFENLGAIAGDIFYYNHATTSPGFSKIHEDRKFGNDMVISSVFARLVESLPLIKIEMLGYGYDNDDFKLILNKILKNSIGGYPYALKLAHNNCKISNRDLAKLASIHGLSNEIGSREILE